MKAKNKNTTTTVIWIALVLASAVGLGYAIRQIRWSLATRENLSKPDSQVVESEPDVEAVPEPEPEPEAELVEADEIVVEEPVWDEPEEEPELEVAAEPQRENWQFGQNSGLIKKFFDDLNLNEQEQARLQEGIALMRRRFENMSDEERWAEFARMAEMGQRWQNMTDQEREGVTQRMRERYEVWRHSDSIEIPQLTFD
ncbi:MAG TPA: hypothetical protein ENI81_00190 [Phycisphaerales bacterium]|nr:hypothetical protein [Phycisphaerales bacterium]